MFSNPSDFIVFCLCAAPFLVMLFAFRKND